MLDIYYYFLCTMPFCLSSIIWARRLAANPLITSLGTSCSGISRSRLLSFRSSNRLSSLRGRSVISLKRCTSLTNACLSSPCCLPSTYCQSSCCPPAASSFASSSSSSSSSELSSLSSLSCSYSDYLDLPSLYDMLKSSLNLSLNICLEIAPINLLCKLCRE